MLFGLEGLVTLVLDVPATIALSGGNILLLILEMLVGFGFTAVIWGVFLVTIDRRMTAFRTKGVLVILLLGIIAGESWYVYYSRIALGGASDELILTYFFWGATIVAFSSLIISAIVGKMHSVPTSCVILLMGGGTCLWFLSSFGQLAFGTFLDSLPLSMLMIPVTFQTTNILVSFCGATLLAIAARRWMLKIDRL